MGYHREAGRVEPTHPALPGHFPGNPIVPGVLLLARVLNVAAAAWNARSRTVIVAKFHSRLMPGEDFAIELECEDVDARFRVVRGETLIATGILKLERLFGG